MRRLRRQFQHELVVIGVHTAKFTHEHDIRHVRQAVMRHGITHPVVNDTGAGLWQAYAVRAWPTVVLIDPEGYVVGQQAGEIRAETVAAYLGTVRAGHAARGTLDPSPLALCPETDAEPERRLRYPAKLLADGDRLLVADTGHHRVLEIALDGDGRSGRVRRTFGSGEPGLRDGEPSSARFHHPRGLSRHGATLYVADTENHAIRAIDLDSGAVSSLAGTGDQAAARIVPGVPTATALRSPWDVLATDGVLFIAMAGAHQIWALLADEDDPLGQLVRFAGSGREALYDGPPSEASFNQPSGLAFFNRRLIIADPEASAVRAIELDGTTRVRTLVGEGLFDFGDVDGPGTSARLQHPTGVAVDGDRILVADTYNHKIKRLDPERRRVSAWIGDGTPGLADGPFAEARLYEPEGLSLAAGVLWIADTNNHAIRRADLARGELTTLAWED